MRSERSSYWRLTALDEFDGEIWRSSYSTDDADGELPRAIDPATESETVTQEVTIDALASVWLPAALEPVALEPGPDEEVVYDERSSTLMVDRDVTTSDGYSYTVTSEVADWTDDELRTGVRRGARRDREPLHAAARATSRSRRWPRRPRSPETPPPRTTRRSRCRTTSAAIASPTTSSVGPGHSNQALHDVPVRDAARLLRAVRRPPSPPSPAPSACPRGWPWASPPACRTRTTPRCSGCGASTPTPGPRCTWASTGGCRSSRRSTAARPRAQEWLGISEQQDTSTGGAAVTDPDLGRRRRRATPGPRRRPATTSASPVAGWARVRWPAARPPPRTGDPFLARVLDDTAPAAGIGVAAYLLLVPLALAGAAGGAPPAGPGAGRPRAARLAHARPTGRCDAGLRLPPWMTIAEKADAMAAAFPGRRGRHRRPGPADGRGGLRRGRPRGRAVGRGRARLGRHPGRRSTGDRVGRAGSPRWFDVRRLLGAARAGRGSSPGPAPRHRPGLRPSRWALGTAHAGDLVVDPSSSRPTGSTRRQPETA